MAFQERGTPLGDSVFIEQPFDKWSLGEVSRTCTREGIVKYPEIIDQLDSDYELGTPINQTYPYVRLTKREAIQLTDKPHLARLVLSYEQTEPDPDEVVEVPEDEISVDASYETKPINEHPDAQEIGSDLYGYLVTENGRPVAEIANTADVPQALRGRKNYKKSIVRVRVTKFSATPFDYPVLNQRIDPEGNESEFWLITGGFNQRRGRWYTQTLVHAFDPDGYPEPLYEVYES